MKDNVKLRSLPSVASASGVVGRLSLGAIASKIEKKGQWIRVEGDSVRGWIMSSLAMDSVKAPKTFWDRMEAVKIAAAKREEKLKEAERILQEKKIRQEQLALAKQKAVEEEKRKKAELSAAQSEPGEKIAAAAKLAAPTGKIAPVFPAPRPAPIEKVSASVMPPP